MMEFKLEGRFERTDIWREGKWLDLWSVVHLLSGVSTAFALSFFQFGAAPALIIGFLLLVLYEMWEAVAEIEETPQNRFMDVVVGMLSFVPVLLYLTPALSASNTILVFGLVLTLNIVMATFGWLASRKAAVLEAALREDIERQRRKFKESRQRFLAKRLARRLRRFEREPR